MVRSQSTPLRMILAMVLIALLLQGAQGLSVAHAQSSADAQYDTSVPENLTAGDLLAASAILIDGTSGKVLFDKNGSEVMYPASTTKIMTLLLGVEYGHLDDEITIGAEATQVPSDSSMLYINVGERIVYRDLLYGFMLRSGNDAANSIAVTVAGSLSSFVDMMNARAAALGLQNTHFVNAHGYHDANHYTTAHDIALITREAMKNQTFREIVRSYEYTMPQTNMQDARRLASTDMMINPASQFYNSTSIGVKTGATSDAGYCFVGASRKDGKDLISVVFNTALDGRWTDTKHLFDYGYTRYEKHTFAELYGLAPLSAAVSDHHPNDDLGGALPLDPVPGSTDDYSVLCLPGELGEVVQDFHSRLSVTYTHDLVAPIQKGDILGTLSLKTDEGETLMTTVIAGRDVQAAPPSFSLANYVPQLENVNATFIRFLCVVALLVVVLLFALNMSLKARRRRKRREAMARRREARRYAARAAKDRTGRYYR